MLKKELEPVNPWGRLASFHIQRASRAMSLTLTAQLRRLDLRPSEATMLCIIDSNPGISQATISQMIATRRPNISPITRDLRRRALIERGRVEGRNLGWSTTAEGGRVAREVNAIITDNDKIMLEVIPPHARGAFATGLEGCGQRFLELLHEIDPDSSLTLEPG